MPELSTMYTLRVFNGDDATGEEDIDQRMTYPTLAEAMEALRLTIEEYAGDGFTASQFHNRTEILGDCAVRFIAQTESGEDDPCMCPVYAEVTEG